MKPEQEHNKEVCKDCGGDELVEREGHTLPCLTCTPRSADGQLLLLTPKQMAGNSSEEA